MGLLNLRQLDGGTMRTLGFVIALVLVVRPLAAEDVGYQKEVTVREPTRLDWVFANANQSVANPPAEWLEGYDSAKQRYELFVPATTKAATSKTKAKSKAKNAEPADAGVPLVLFLSASDQPAGWGPLQSVCQQKGIAFASPYNAGNNTPMPRRIRIVFDVLDDLRRKHRIDADRTYIAGFSGGGRVACGIAFALPELFGGVIPVCASGDLRDEPWLRHRVIDRLSVAMITGSGDFNRGEIERFRGPMLTDVGVRTKVTVVEKLGHGIPDAKTFTEAIEWLDAGVADRRKLAVKHPASRIGSETTPTREEWAKLLLAEGQSRLKEPKTLYSGLMQLQGVMQRWPDLKAADDAKRVLLDYESRQEKPWEEDNIDEQRRFLIARARALDAYASGELPPQYVNQRKDMLEAAINLWTLVIQDGQDDKAVDDGQRRLPKLQALLKSDGEGK
jgi:pimeloyl-ACP methyl ester carboxylesterase